MTSPDRTPRLELEHLAVRELRNLEHLSIEPAPGLNVISGDNGHGKTTLLEAIYLVATSKSFRTSVLAELTRHGADQASVRARFSETSEHDEERRGPAREQLAVISKRRASVRIDNNRVPTLAEFATRSPVVIFHPDEMTLSTGPALGRRTLLDRVALYVEPSAADHRARYQRALRARHQLLRDKGSAGAAARNAAGPERSGRAGPERSGRAGPIDPALDAFEELCAVHGAALTRARAAAAERLMAELHPAFTDMAAQNLALEASYRPGGSADVETARAELARQRSRDAFRASAGFGPHRDDLILLLDGHAARVVASQGQHRVMTLALKAAETACIARARGVEPLLLLDDVSSELDRDRTEALFRFLAHQRGQLFLTTTRPELIRADAIATSERADFRLVNGHLVNA